MQFKNLTGYQKEICDAFSECQNQLLGTPCNDFEVFISGNIIVIISRGTPTIDEVYTRMTLRGRRVDSVLRDMKKEVYDSLMKARLAEITGRHVVCSYSDIVLRSQEKVEIYCLEESIVEALS
ncbi:Na-translocating system protein MpsC family protein [Lihuaxuella thermophila]|uniref:Uncharacterized conserved protein n=1 Tax=Lihuaxuella thermophila TaxID=1173111 RepID=A0A1H8CHP6_9BACL|nr:Na-translocating system protein MpsC family protein [Lihuaxuella thermophila]SEM93788.1 Uncharacterized conserved protein [Lihuaxuella thermophila]